MGVGDVLAYSPSRKPRRRTRRRRPRARRRCRTGRRPPRTRRRRARSRAGRTRRPRRWPRALADDNDLDLRLVKGSRPRRADRQGGRRQRDRAPPRGARDRQPARRAGGAGRAGRPAPPRSRPPPPPPAPAPAPPPAATRPEAAAAPRSACASRRRQTIAARLVEAQRTAAMLTTNEIDMTAVMEVRAPPGRVQRGHGVSLGFLSFFTKAGSVPLKAFPCSERRDPGRRDRGQALTTSGWRSAPRGWWCPSCATPTAGGSPTSRRASTPDLAARAREQAELDQAQNS